MLDAAAERERAHLRERVAYLEDREGSGIIWEDLAPAGSWEDGDDPLMGATSPIFAIIRGTVFGPAVGATESSVLATLPLAYAPLDGEGARVLAPAVYDTPVIKSGAVGVEVEDDVPTLRVHTGPALGAGDAVSFNFFYAVADDEA